MDKLQQSWKPKRWLATLLSLLLGGTGMLYACNFKWYLFYALTPLLLVALIYFAVGNIFLLGLANLFALVNLVSIVVCTAHTFKICSRFQPIIQRPWYSHWWGIFGIYLLIIVPIVIIRAFFFEPFHIPARSMAPTYNKGDYIIISKFGYGNYGTYGVNFFHAIPSKTIQRGDVVVFSYPPDPKIDYIKRVIGVPNDKLSYTNKTLTINGKRLNTEALPQENERGREILIKESYENTSWRIINIAGMPSIDFELVVPANSYFVMGDNRDNSRDSRHWGVVPAENVKGKVIYSTAINPDIHDALNPN